MTRRNKQTKEVQDINNFMHEVEETMRIERLTQIWNDYKYIMIGAVFALFLSLSGHTYWKHTQEMKRQSLMDELYILSEKENITWENYEPLTHEKSVGISFQAYLEQVKLLLAEHKRAEALLKLDQLIFNARYPLSLRQLASLYKSDIALKEEPEVSVDILTRLVNEKTPFIVPTLQRLGFAYEKQGKTEDAVRTYKQLLKIKNKVTTETKQLVLQRLSGLRKS